MNLQTRKIHFVQEFLKLNDEQIIEKLEGLLKSEKNKGYSIPPTVMTVQDLNSEIDVAENDAQNGRLTNVQDLRNKIKSWN